MDEKRKRVFLGLEDRKGQTRCLLYARLLSIVWKLTPKQLSPLTISLLYEPLWLSVCLSLSILPTPFLQVPRPGSLPVRSTLSPATAPWPPSPALRSSSSPNPDGVACSFKLFPDVVMMGSTVAVPSTLRTGPSPDGRS